MKNRVITISREFGSGGRTIGKKVAEKLGIPCYDAEIIQEMAKETGFAPDYVKEAGEYAPGSFLSSAFSNRMFAPVQLRIEVGREVKDSVNRLSAHQFLRLVQTVAVIGSLGIW